MTTEYLNAKRQRTWSQFRGRADPKGGRANEAIAPTTGINVLQPVLLRIINPHRSPFLTWNIAQWYSVCLAGKRSWVRYTV